MTAVDTNVIVRFLSEARLSHADLADLLVAHSAQSSGCQSAITFDKRAARLPFFRLLV